MKPGNKHPGYKPMKLDASTEALTRRYLLGNMSEDEREQVESRLMTDDEFFRQINLIEDELVDDYLSGALSPKDRKRFEVTFLCAPERQHKLRFARALHTYAANTAHERATEGLTPKISWWQPILAILSPQRPALAYALAAAVLVLLIGGPWTIIRLVDLGNQMAALQKNTEAEESRLRSLYHDERTKTGQLAARLRQEQEKWAASPQAGSAAPGGSRIAMAHTLSILLTPGVMRGAQPAQRVEIPQGTALVCIKLDLAENRHKTYKALVLVEGQEILSRSGLKASEGANQITLSLILPASDLATGDYEIRLFGTGQSEPFEYYVVHFAKK